MKVFSEKTVVSKELTEVLCNKCGQAIAKDLGYWEDYISISKTWGYYSPADGETHALDICAACYFEWIKDFKIPPQATEHA